MEQLKEIWPKWEIVEVLGQGGFGTVYKAKRDNYGDTIYAAIKVVKIPNNHSEIKEMTGSGLSHEHIKSYYKKSILGLVDEIKMMSKFKTASHIVSIEDYDVVENSDGIGGTIYIRMELLKNITDYFDIHNINKDEVVKMAIDILTALEFCHKQNVVHRDIKLGNIFISEFNEFKLGDFGISREVEKTNATMSQKGTKSYMAPEMIRMEKYGKNVDLYALGLTMYELLNHGRIPFLPEYPEPFFPQDREEAMIKRLMGEEFPDIKGLGKLNDIIKKACHPLSEERYKDATEMKAALLSLNNNEQPDSKKTIINEEKTVLGDNTTIGMFNDLPFENIKQEDNGITKDQVLDYVINRFNIENHINLRNDSLAVARLEDTIAKKLDKLNRNDKVLLDIPYLTIGNDGALDMKMIVEKDNIFNKSSNNQSKKQFSGWIFDENNKGFKQNTYQTDKKEIKHSIICPHCGGLALLQATGVYACTKCGKWINDGLDTHIFNQIISLFSEYNDDKNANNYSYQLSIIHKMKELVPECAQIYMREGQLYSALNNYEAQLQCYTKAYELDPNDAIVLNGLCAYYIKQSNWEKAKEYGERAHELLQKGKITRTNNEGILAANFSIALENVNLSMRAHSLLKTARSHKYTKCDALAMDWGIGSNYYNRIINDVYAQYKPKFSKYIKDDITSLNQSKNVLKVHNRAKMIFACEGNSWFGHAYYMAVSDRAIHFYTNKEWYMPYYNLIEYDISYQGKDITLVYKYNTNSKYTISIGKDAYNIYLFLKELQRRL